MIPINETLPPAPLQEVSSPPVVSTPPPPKKSTFDKVTGVGKIIGNDVQQGLSYANARRARETYRG